MDDDDMMTAPHLNTTVIDAALPWEDTFDLPNVDSTNSLWCEAPGNLGGIVMAWLKFMENIQKKQSKTSPMSFVLKVILP